MSGYLSAFTTVVIWGSTFVSTKILLRSASPIEILFFRFLIGYFALFLLRPKILKVKSGRQELVFFAAAFTGLFMYYVFENTALIYSYASSVSVIISSAAFFSALFVSLVYKGEENVIGIPFFAGFVISMIGISMISFSGGGYTPSLKGDSLALLSAVSWGLYSVFIKKISLWGYDVISATRRVFFYGALILLPVFLIAKDENTLLRLTEAGNLLNILYLGLFASALSFVTWNNAVRKIGASKTGLFVYLSPVITVILSFLILKEKPSAFSTLGMIVTIIGLLTSEIRRKRY